MNTGNFKKNLSLPIMAGLFFLGTISFTALAKDKVTRDINSTIQSDCSARSVQDLYGTYRLTHLERFGGGLTSLEEAKKNLGKSLELKPNQFRDLNIRIKDPSYKIHCTKVSGSEGDVQPRTSLLFYGFGGKRHQIQTLNVSNKKKDDYPFSYEIVLKNYKFEIWSMNDGFFYEYTKSKETTITPERKADAGG
ncbi:hypothetical protein [Salinisphaera sp. Q1T1-3]|uniref:hypothetical protein n=1 Tax=Salinisphaera sp. Q1T1-3 TaxID=2321229 RepID=UPI0011C4AACF|nr:hypothetical protein [Salinisphaera sp. Q1T1-3]